MPIYEYRCDRGHTFEVLQRMTDDPVTVCTTCDAKVQRVLHPVAVHFKGSGFYTTDYARSGKPAGGDGSASSGSTESSDAGKNGSDKSGSTSTKAEKSGSTEGTSTASKSASSD